MLAAYADHIWQSTVVAAAALLLLALCGRWLSARARRAIAWMALAKFLVPAMVFTSVIRVIDPPAHHWLAPAPLFPAAHLPTTLRNFLASTVSPRSAALATRPSGASAAGLERAGATGTTLTQTTAATNETAKNLSPLRRASPGSTAMTATDDTRVAGAVRTETAVLAAIWAMGASAVALSFILRSLALRRRFEAARAAPVDSALQRKIVLAADRAALARPPPGYLIDADSSPAAYGIVSSALLVPRGIDTALEGAELDAILLHECVHLAHRDNLWSIAQAALLSLNWYNPLVWILGRRIQLETEMRCDEAVLAHVADPELYVGALAKATRYTLGLLPPGSAPAGSSPLGIRLGNILSYRPSRRRPWLAAPAIGMTACAVFLSGYAGSITAASALPTGAGLGSPSGPVDPRMALYEPTSMGTPITVTLVGPGGMPLPPADHRAVPPTAKALPLPTYPMEMRKAGISGTAVVEFTVDATGAVQNAILRNYDQPEFGAAAMLAVPSWKFLPARKDGRPIDARIRMRFNFWASPGPTGMPAEAHQVSIDLHPEAL